MKHQHHLESAIIVLEHTRDQYIKDESIRKLFTILAGHVSEAKAMADRWPAGDVDPTDEPRLVKYAMDEIGFYMRNASILTYQDEADRQYTERGLSAALVLVTLRYMLLQRAGRVDGLPGNEEDIMARQFDMSIAGIGSAAYPGMGAAIQDAMKLGARGGEWASVILYWNN